VFSLRLGGLAVAIFLMSGGSALALPSSTADGGTANANARVRAVVQKENRTFIGGDFTAVDGATRQRVARLDAAGARVAWRVRVTGADPRVYALALSGDGSRLYIGGRFTKVNGVGRKNIAAVRASTGRLIRSWRGRADATVRVIARRRSTLYIGGDFKNVRGKHRVRLAALSTTTGAVRRWRPLANRAVRALAVRGKRVYAGGDFTKVSRRPGGNLVSRDHLVSLHATRGTISAFNPGPEGPVNGIATATGFVYLGTGGECTAPECNAVLAYDTADDSQPAWICGGDGDVHALVRSGGVLYAGGHWQDSTDCLNLRRLMAIDRTDGSATGWNPRPNGFGVLALHAWRGTRLAVGGEFTRVSAQDHDNYAQFTGNLTTP
jgi:Domain of unknown function (DUF5122) beta-propeller